jgi:trans-aconitate 2-methyltransferase
MSWSANQYVIFENERTRPVRDLLASLPGRDVQVAVDLGCGPGNSTEALAAHFPGAAIVGLDSSADMVAAARERMPHLQFATTGIETWDDPGPFGVILANAVLQWVPDHAAVFPRLLSKLERGGSLAVQMPDNQNEPSHRLMREVATNGPWAEKLANVARTSRQSANWYYELLRPRCTQVDIWRTTYHHPLAGGAAAIVEWFKGSSLRPILAALGEFEQTMYIDRYTTALAEAYPALPDGTVLLPFPRLFIVATR